MLAMNMSKPIDALGTQVGFGRHVFENDDSYWNFSVPKQEKNYLMQTQEAMNNWFKQHCQDDALSDCSSNRNDSSCGLSKRSHSADTFHDEDESLAYDECRTAHSFAIHEDHLFEEMKQLAANHKIAQKNRPMSKKSATSTSPQQDKLFISNTLTIKFLEHGDTVLITVPEDWQITGCVDINLHLRVGKVLEKYNLDEECLIEVASPTEDNVEQVVIPSFCLCLEDKVLYERMKNKRNRIQQRRNSSENIKDTFTSKDTISIMSTDSSSSSSSSSSKSSKPKRKQKSC